MPLLALILLVLQLVVGPAGAQETDPILVEVVPTSVPAGGTAELEVRVAVPGGFHVYRDMMELRVDAGPLRVGEPIFPLGITAPDPAFPDKTREMFEEDFVVAVPVTAPSDAAIGPVTAEVHFRHQACKGNLCYLPREQSFRVEIAVAGVVLGVREAEAAAAPPPVPAGVRPVLTEEDPVAVRASGGAGIVEVTFFQAEGWHVNRGLTWVELAPGGPLTAGTVTWPEGEVHKDAYGGERVEIGGDFTVRVPVSGPPGTHEVKLQAGYQACKSELCHMPRTVDLSATVQLDGTAPAPAGAAAGAAATDGGGAALASSPSGGGVFSGDLDQLRARGLLWLVLGVFAGGFLVSLTPCVLPLVPITMGIIGARSAGSRWQAASLSLTYVAGLALVYTGLGLTAGLTGSLFGAWMQHAWVVVAVGVFFAAMGLAMFGLFDVAVPSSLATRLNQLGGAGYGGALVVGMVGALVAGPCSGPVIAWLMALIGTEGEVLLGGGLMLAFSLGMGVIFLLAGVFSGSLLRPGPWMEAVKRVFGVVMLLGALWYVRSLLPDWLLALLTAAVLLTTAVFAWPRSEEDGFVVARLHKLYAVVAGLVGGWLLVVLMVVHGFILDLPARTLDAAPAAATAGITWLHDEAEAVALARRENRPLMVDFTAEWCTACQELEHRTYTDPRVVEASRAFVPVMLDFTRWGDPEVERLRKAYGVVGLPTVKFVAPDGTHLDDLTVTGFLKADDFLARMTRALERKEG